VAVLVAAGNHLDTLRHFVGCNLGNFGRHFASFVVAAVDVDCSIVASSIGNIVVGSKGCIAAKRAYKKVYNYRD